MPSDREQRWERIEEQIAALDEERAAARRDRAQAEAKWHDCWWECQEALLPLQGRLGFAWEGDHAWLGLWHTAPARRFGRKRWVPDPPVATAVRFERTREGIQYQVGIPYATSFHCGALADAGAWDQIAAALIDIERGRHYWTRWTSPLRPAWQTLHVWFCWPLLPFWPLLILTLEGVTGQPWPLTLLIGGLIWGIIAQAAHDGDGIGGSFSTAWPHTRGRKHAA